MDYLELFKNELELEHTRYFILDTKGSGSDHGDVDFTQYRWQTNKFGKVRENDLFLYRRPGKASETKKFYFFGAAKIGKITPINNIKEKRVEAKIESEYPLKTHLHPHDLEDYQWDFKERTPGTWEHFFNQYGMNEITRVDFLNLLSLSENDDISYDPKAATEALQSIQRKNYYVEDEKGSYAKRSKQSVFSNTVKNNYKNQCAICGITTRSLLIG